MKVVKINQQELANIKGGFWGWILAGIIVGVIIYLATHSN
jgi:lactobin A/cerein 7B family class IIb bacteriocin